MSNYKLPELKANPKLLLENPTKVGTTICVLPSGMQDFENWITELHQFDFGFEMCIPASVQYENVGVNNYKITVYPH